MLPVSILGRAISVPSWESCSFSGKISCSQGRVLSPTHRGGPQTVAALLKPQTQPASHWPTPRQPWEALPKLPRRRWETVVPAGLEILLGGGAKPRSQFPEYSAWRHSHYPLNSHVDVHFVEEETLGTTGLQTDRGQNILTWWKTPIIFLNSALALRAAVTHACQ